MPHFIAEITIRNPPIEAQDADEARQRMAAAYAMILGCKYPPPQIIEISVQEVEDLNG